MKLPKFEGNHVAEANTQFAALLKEAEALEAASRTRIVEIQVRCWGGEGREGLVCRGGRRQVGEARGCGVELREH